MNQLTDYRSHFEIILNHYLATLSAPSAQLLAAVRYACQDGKRLRPLLLYATGVNFDLPISLLDQAAIAIELIHVYSLIHDDLPAMDNDDFRRGRPSCHKAFSEATALLAGNALQTQAFQLLAEQTLEPEIKIATIQILTEAIGLQGMMAGQDLDLIQQTKSIDQIEEIHRLKTGKLIEACLLIPAAMAKQSAEINLTLKQFADAAALAFQLQDDLDDLQKQEHSSYAQQQGINTTKTTIKKLYQQAEQKLISLGQPPLLSHWLNQFIGTVLE